MRGRTVHAVSAVRRGPERVETQEAYRQCRHAGCDWFQGYFFCEPRVIQDPQSWSWMPVINQYLIELHEASSGQER